MGFPVHGVFTASLEFPGVSSGLFERIFLCFGPEHEVSHNALVDGSETKNNQREESIYIVAALQPAPAGS
jgi:hypothetical protein